jgi:hypothetical protein
MTQESFYETPFRLVDGRTLVVRSKNPFPMGECPYQVHDAVLFSQSEYEQFLAANKSASI